MKLSWMANVWRTAWEQVGPGKERTPDQVGLQKSLWHNIQWLANSILAVQTTYSQTGGEERGAKEIAAYVEMTANFFLNQGIYECILQLFDASKY